MACEESWDERIAIASKQAEVSQESDTVLYVSVLQNAARHLQERGKKSNADALCGSTGRGLSGQSLTKSLTKKLRSEDSLLHSVSIELANKQEKSRRMRKEAVQLEKALRSLLNEVDSKQSTDAIATSPFLRKAIVIRNVGNELIRQVSKGCLEHGRVMASVFKFYQISWRMLPKELISARKEIADLSKQVEHLQTTVDKEGVFGGRHELKSRLDESRLECENLILVQRGLESRLFETKNTLERTQTEYALLEKECNVLRAQLEEQVQLAQSNKMQEALSQQRLDKAQSDVDRLYKEQDQYKAAHEKLSSDLQSARQRIRKLESQLEMSKVKMQLVQPIPISYPIPQKAKKATVEPKEPQEEELDSLPQKKLRRRRSTKGKKDTPNKLAVGDLRPSSSARLLKKSRARRKSIAVSNLSHMTSKPKGSHGRTSRA